MVCEKPVEQTKVMDNSLTLPNSVEQNVVAHENDTLSVSASSSVGPCSNIRDDNGQDSIVAKDVRSQPTSYYSYYYPGYDLSYPQSDDGRDNSSMGMQGDHGSIAYFMPGYNPYAAGTFVGTDGHPVSQAIYATSGYLQTPVTYGAEAVPCYAWDMSYLGNPSDGANRSLGTSEPVPSTTTRVRSNGIKPSQLYGPAIGKRSTLSSNSKSRQSVAASNISQPKFDTQPLKPLTKSGSYIHSAGFANPFHPVGNFHPSSSLQKQGPYANNGAMAHRPNARMLNVNDKSRYNRKNECGMSTELTCGPRTQNRSSSGASEKQAPGLGVQKDEYNLSDFQTVYETAKFYVIKSFSEDDVHKCLKYSVWSSTANGNKKLDAAFHDAEVKAAETGIKCPIFLFFSVNASGQFVGLVEMLGKVDFNKNMDFWQLDKWSGFFPVKWHIVKDVPNSQLRHILLENNANRPVTYTRDTQEIGLKQGLEMLKIFKNYLAKTSLLDDFDFYENRQKAPQNRSNSLSGGHQTELYGNGNISKHLGSETNGEESRDSHVAPVSSLVNLTKNLSINSDPKISS